MEIDHGVNVNEIGTTFAELVKNDDRVFHVWVRKRLGVFEIWLMTTCISFEQELELYQLVDILHDRYPQTSIEFHMIKPRLFSAAEVTAIKSLIPPNAANVFSRL